MALTEILCLKRNTVYLQALLPKAMHLRNHAGPSIRQILVRFYGVKVVRHGQPRAKQS